MPRNRNEPAARKNKGHPRRERRRLRAQERDATHVCTPDCKRYRTGRTKWADAQTMSQFVRELIREHGTALDALGNV